MVKVFGNWLFAIPELADQWHRNVQFANSTLLFVSLFSSNICYGRLGWVNLEY